MLNWMRSVEKIPSIPGIMTGLVELSEYLRSELGPGAVMYEIGSFAGESAQVFAAYFRAVHCVDPWLDACGATSAAEVEASFDERAAICGNLVKHKCGSLDIVTSLPFDGLDFVYVDAGAHSYEENMRDIKAWWPHVRKGGFIGGHDYEIPSLHAADTFPGVEQSVRDFFGGRPDEFGFRVFPDTSWVVRKP